MRNQRLKMLNSLKPVKIKYTSSCDNIENSCEKETQSAAIGSPYQVLHRLSTGSLMQVLRKTDLVYLVHA